MRRVAFFLLLLGVPLVLAQERLLLPLKPDSVRLAVIGDNGTGGSAEYEIGRQLVAWRAKFPYSFVIMNGDNIYGGDSPKDFLKKFEAPYQQLIAGGVVFHAVLGNHDDPNQTKYKLYSMNGDRYYSFKPKNGVRFFALDSNYMDKKQLDWLEKELSASKSDWKICYFHHPIYSSGKTHGPDLELRKALEPLFVKYEVSVVFAGHEHFYERIKPQNGIYYFISGAAGQLRQGNIRRTDITAKGYDEDNHFMLVEIAGDEMFFQTVNRAGATVDSGVIRRPTSKPDTNKSTNKSTSTTQQRPNPL